MKARVIIISVVPATRRGPACPAPMHPRNAARDRRPISPRQAFGRTRMACGRLDAACARRVRRGRTGTHTSTRTRRVLSAASAASAWTARRCVNRRASTKGEWPNGLPRVVWLRFVCLFVCGGLSETGGLPARMCEASRSPPPDCVAATHHAVRARPRKLRISITGDRGCPGPRAQPAMPRVVSGRVVGVGWRTCSCSRSSRSCASCTIDRFACSFKFARPIVLSNQAWPQTQTQHARASQRVSECLSDARSSVQRDL